MLRAEEFHQSRPKYEQAATALGPQKPSGASYKYLNNMNTFYSLRMITWYG